MRAKDDFINFKNVVTGTFLLVSAIRKSYGICDIGLMGNVGCFNVGLWNRGFFNLGLGNKGLINTGILNGGYGNLGFFNEGIRNYGMTNTGISNAGAYNLGALQGGILNIGVGNVGNMQTGIFNLGLANMGTRNTGIGNNGVGQLGLRNVGAYNAGLLNKGIGNKGSLTLGLYNNGILTKGIANSGISNHGVLNKGAFNLGIKQAGKLNVGKYQAGTGNVGAGNLGVLNKGIGQVGLKQWGVANVGLVPQIGVWNFPHTKLVHWKNNPVGINHYPFGPFQIVTKVPPSKIYTPYGEISPWKAVPSNTIHPSSEEEFGALTHPLKDSPLFDPHFGGFNDPSSFKNNSPPGTIYTPYGKFPPWKTIPSDTIPYAFGEEFGELSHPWKESSPFDPHFGGFNAPTSPKNKSPLGTIYTIYGEIHPRKTNPSPSEEFQGTAHQ